MELVYSVDPSSESNRFDSDKNFCCSLSCRNLLAYSVSKADDSSSSFNRVYQICIIDVDQPWEPHTVTSFCSPITKLEWDCSGNRILIATSSGECAAFKMKDFLIDQWEECGRSDMNGEDIITLLWLHNGVKLGFNPDKRENILYAEKFVKTPFTPSLTHFGGKPLDGWIAITSTGLVSVSMVHKVEGRILAVTENLSPNHQRVCHADIAYTPTGQIIVSMCDDTVNCIVQVFSLTLKMLHNNCNIICKAESGFSLKGATDPEASSSCVLDLQFANNETPDVLLITHGKSGRSQTEVWHLVDQSCPVNKIFNAQTEMGFRLTKWVHQTSISHNAILMSLSGPQLPITRSIVENAGFIPYFAAVYRDGCIKVIHRFSYQVIYTTSLENACTSAIKSEFIDERQSSSYLTYVKQTFSGCGLIGMQREKLYFFRMFNIREGPLQLSPPFILLLLEYCIVSGYDWWDIFLSMRQGMIEAINQKLSDNFQKQPQTVQDLLQLRLLGLKMSLFQSSSAGQLKTADSHARIILQAITTELRSIIRPKSSSAQDRTPAEKVQNLCAKMSETDLDSIIATIDMDEFIVESRKKEKMSSQGALVSLQPLIQWVTDFSLHLMASLPLYQTYPNFPGSLLLRDATVLNSLREILIVTRIWGLINPQCLPTFTTSSGDIIAQLFKLVTKCWIYVKDGGNLEHDENLMDECCMLPSRVLIPNLTQSFGSDSTGYLMFTQQHPISFTSKQDPDFAISKKISWYVCLPDLPTESKQCHDIIRQMHLGIVPSEAAKECCRCGGVSLIRSMAKSNIQKAWENRWMKSCLCSGHWRAYNQRYHT